MYLSKSLAAARHHSPFGDPWSARYAAAAVAHSCASGGEDPARLRNGHRGEVVHHTGQSNGPLKVECMLGLLLRGEPQKPY